MKQPEHVLGGLDGQQTRLSAFLLCREYHYFTGGLHWPVFSPVSVDEAGSERQIVGRCD